MITQGCIFRLDSEESKILPRELGVSWQLPGTSLRSQRASAAPQTLWDCSRVCSDPSATDEGSKGHLQAHHCQTGWCSHDRALFYTLSATYLLFSWSPILYIHRLRDLLTRHNENSPGPICWSTHSIARDSSWQEPGSQSFAWFQGDLTGCPHKGREGLPGPSFSRMYQFCLSRYASVSGNR